tara:strand:+ start:332 stop:877 length:546 start_codon:yes stop_codon:yes gene_type:complete
VGKRPKESAIGIGTGILSAYSANKVRKLGKEFNQNMDSLEQKIDMSNTMILNGISSLADLQVATMAGIHNIYLEVQELSNAQSSLVQHFENVQAEKERLGDLKLFLRSIRKEVEKISKIAETHPVYATFMAENLVEMFDSHNIEIAHFKMLPVNEIDWAEEIIDSVSELHRELLKKLEAKT